MATRLEELSFPCFLWKTVRPRPHGSIATQTRAWLTSLICEAEPSRTSVRKWFIFCCAGCLKTVRPGMVASPSGGSPVDDVLRASLVFSCDDGGDA